MIPGIPPTEDDVRTELFAVMRGCPGAAPSLVRVVLDVLLRCVERRWAVAEPVSLLVDELRGIVAQRQAEDVQRMHERHEAERRQQQRETRRAEDLRRSEEDADYLHAAVGAALAAVEERQRAAEAARVVDIAAHRDRSG